MGEMSNANKISVDKPEGKRLIERSMPRWEDHIRMDLRKIWWEISDWRHVAKYGDQWRVLVNTEINLMVL
jgi:hypothetical protein